jgi:hypothetical protein
MIEAIVWSSAIDRESLHTESIPNSFLQVVKYLSFLCLNPSSLRVLLLS